MKTMQISGTAHNAMNKTCSLATMVQSPPDNAENWLGQKASQFDNDLRSSDITTIDSQSDAQIILTSGCDNGITDT